MKKYKKVTDIEVLKKYCEIQNDMNRVGCWCDYLSIKFLAEQLKTSEYKIQKAYKSLKERGFIELKKYPTYSEEYDNGLYTEASNILFTKVYVPTNKGRKEVENGSNN